jgi:hypothetical protein
MQIMSALKHSCEGKDLGQENNPLPKIFDQTCKIEKNVRMLVVEVFSFPEKYFIKSWLEVAEINQDQSTPIEIRHKNIAKAIAKSVRPVQSTKSSNEVDPLLLNEFLSVIE